MNLQDHANADRVLQRLGVLMDVRRSLKEVRQFRERNPNSLDVGVQDFAMHVNAEGKQHSFNFAQSKATRGCLRKALKAVLTDALWYLQIQLEQQEKQIAKEVEELLNTPAPKVE